MVMYECESVHPDGACRAPFVVIWARQEGELPVNVTQLIFGEKLRDVCFERGDFKAAFSNSEYLDQAVLPLYTFLKVSYFFLKIGQIILFLYFYTFFYTFFCSRTFLYFF